MGYLLVLNITKHKLVLWCNLLNRQKVAPKHRLSQAAALKYWQHF